MGMSIELSENRCKEEAEDVMEKKNHINGLSEAEVLARKEQGLVNQAECNVGKGVKEIILSNLFTYFNLIFLVITVLLCMVRSFRSLTFLPIVVGNVLIGIIQEIRAKRVLDKMSLLNAPHAMVIRDGVQKQISSEELVKDDVVLFSSGDQICADARVLEGSIQVNEALLTGEQDEIQKTAGSELMSGSFVVSGECYAVLEKVGNEAYISKLAQEAKSLNSGEQSEMVRSINKIVKWMGILLIPIGLILYYQGYYVNHETFQASIVSMVAAIIGMIPEGLYLLTTVALALGTMRLAKNQVLLHDMKSIEALARVDVFCVDKTGTITEPKMQVNEWIPFPEKEGEEPLDKEALLHSYVTASIDKNSTMEALREYFSEKEIPSQEALQVFPFSSAVKYGVVRFSVGTCFLGAPEFILKERYEEWREQLEQYTKKGYRVLLFAYQEETLGEYEIADHVVPLGMVVLSNAIRENAKKTFEYFREQGVEIKVISGDNPETVSEVARLAGIENAEAFVDAVTLDSEEKIYEAAQNYTVFGRVTPKQKQLLVQALKKQKHTVAMTGDGVNDILAMKDADCSIAMASGSEAAAQAAQVVLLDSDFARMPGVVLEGRRVVNNVQRSASLFLVKNIFSLLLAIFSSVLMLTYPFEPSQISLISMFAIGIPGFFLALETNKNRIEGHFLKNVLLKALPAGITDAMVVAFFAVSGQVFRLSEQDISSAATFLIAVVGFMILRQICWPFNRYRFTVFIGSILGIILCSIFLKKLFALSILSGTSILFTVSFCLAAESLFRNLTKLVAWMSEKGLPAYRRKRDVIRRWRSRHSR